MRHLAPSWETVTCPGDTGRLIFPLSMTGLQMAYELHTLALLYQWSAVQTAFLSLCPIGITLAKVFLPYLTLSCTSFALTKLLLQSSKYKLSSNFYFVFIHINFVTSSQLPNVRKRTPVWQKEA